MPNSTIFCDTETTGLDWAKDSILLCGYSVNEGPIKYGVTEELKELLADETNKFVAHNAKFDALFLAANGCDIGCSLEDTRVLAYLNWPEEESHSLKYLVRKRLFRSPKELSDIQFKPLKKDLPYLNKEDYFEFSDGKLVRKDLLVDYHREDILNVIRLRKILKDSEWFLEVEKPLTKILFEMERYGCPLDGSRLSDVSGNFRQRKDILLSDLLVLIPDGFRTALAAKEEAFNPNSNPQIRELFKALGYKLEELCDKTKSGEYSVDKAFLKRLAWKGDKVAQTLLQYRKYNKLLSTYLDPFTVGIEGDGRLHGSINQAGSEDMYGDGGKGTNTGRLASSDPNLQNIPSRTKEGREVRSIFVASPGKFMFDTDLSQIEPRLVAHYTQSPKLLYAYSNNLDTHSLFARDIFGHVPSPVERFIGKSSWLATAYGCSYKKLLVICENYSDDPLQLDLTPYEKAYDSLDPKQQKKVRSDVGVGYRETYAQWMYFKNVQDQFKRTNPEIFQWRDAHIARTKRLGYVVTIGGRRIGIRGLDSTDFRERATAERQAVNYLIQGSAADVMKSIIIRAQKEFVALGYGRIFCTVHDELLGELVDPKYLSVVKDIMETTVTLRNVKIKADTHLINNWGQKK